MNKKGLYACIIHEESYTNTVEFRYNAHAYNNSFSIANATESRMNQFLYSAAHINCNLVFSLVFLNDLE